MGRTISTLARVAIAATAFFVSAGCHRAGVPLSAATGSGKLVGKGDTSVALFRYEAYAYEVRENERRNISVRLRLYHTGSPQGPLRAISGSLADYNTVHEYLLNSIKQDFTLLADGTEIAPASCLFENGYNVTPFETFNLVFLLPGGCATQGARQIFHLTIRR